MPELPEVETVVRDLDEAWRGRRLRALSIGDPRVLAGEGDPRRLAGRVCRGVRRRAKYIIQDWDGVHLIQHLRMTGLMLPDGHARLPSFSTSAKALQRRATFLFGDGPSWIFFDARRFGTLEIVDDPDRFFGERGLAPEPLDDDPGPAAAHFKAALQGRRGPIKSVLLDQTVVAGVGNIYADEGLHRAMIHPRTPADRIRPAQVDALFGALRAVMREAVDRRGTSMADYLDINGNPGLFQTYLGVYGRAGLPCRRCGRMIHRTVLGGRATHWCPGCQRERRKLQVRRR